MKDLQDDMYRAKHEALLMFIKDNNPNIIYGVATLSALCSGLV